MRPDKQLAGLLGLTDAGTTLPTPTCRSTQRRRRAPASSTRRSSSTAPPTATRSAARRASRRSTPPRRPPRPNPAVTLRSVGSQRRPGGRVHLRPRALGRLHPPGQPGLGRQERDGTRRSAPTTCSSAPHRRPQPDWVDFEQGRDPAGRRAAAAARQPDRHDERRQKPLPRFWYFPRGVKAVVVMTGDDHAQRRHGRPVRPVPAPPARRAARSPTGSASAAPRTSTRTRRSPTPRRRPTTPTASRSRCTSTPAATTTRRPRSRRTSPTSSRDFADRYSRACPRRRPTARTASPGATRRAPPQVELAHGIRLDTNYYYWPPPWVHERARASSPARACRCGSPTSTARLIDVYQAPRR